MSAILGVADSVADMAQAEPKPQPHAVAVIYGLNPNSPLSAVSTSVAHRPGRCASGTVMVSFMGDGVGRAPAAVGCVGALLLLLRKTKSRELEMCVVVVHCRRSC